MLYQEADELKREVFQQTLSQYEPEQQVWIDECGLNRDLVRLYGRCPRHQRLYGEHSGKRLDSRISLIAAYCQGLICAPFRFDGYTDSHVFNPWLEQCLLPELSPNQVLILDNATFHKSLKTQQLIASADCHLLFLPSYSPDLNKIEPQWANLKQGVRANQDSDLTLHQKLDIQLIKMSEP
ncbi:MAG: IS630 family transposase [Phototrophicaceae bacterium]